MVGYIITYNILFFRYDNSNNKENTGEKMNYNNYYTKDKIDEICWYYGQYSENLSYNMIAIIIEQYENEIMGKK